MRKLSLMLFVGGFAFAALLHMGAGTAESRPQYAKAFGNMFVKADSSEQSDKDFAAAVKEAKCNVCHAGKTKETRNAFGADLAKLIVPKDWEAGKKFPGETDKDKINKALEEVIAIHIDAKDPKSPTYGDIIKKGKLPASESKPADEKK
jgi:hypothetical protein